MSVFVRFKMCNALSRTIENTLIQTLSEELFDNSTSLTYM